MDPLTPSTSRPGIGRRAALRGLGAAVLALPILPSLLPRSARAAPWSRRRYVHLATPHGGVWIENMFPPEVLLRESRTHAERTIRRGDLSAELRGGDAYLSPVLSAPAARLTPALVRKLNVVQGLDIPFYIGHHTGGHLGNYARNDGNSGEGRLLQEQPRRTIDQVMAWSPEFYGDGLQNARLRSVTLGGPLSFVHANAVAQRGPIQLVSPLPYWEGTQGLYDALFGPPRAGAPRRPVTDRVLADFRRLRDGERRLSSEDRRRLDEHVSRLAELERRLITVPACPGAARPAQNVTATAPDFGNNPAEQLRLFQALNDVLALALGCGATAVATLYADVTFSSFRGDWHQDIAHRAHLPGGAEQQTLRDAHHLFFREVFIDLARKLDAIDDGGGRTVLDNTLLCWTQESGSITHEAQSIPVITAGSAGGALRTGSYIDYRDRRLRFPYDDHPNLAPVYAGLLYNQFLATVLGVVGLPRASWEEPGGGYGLRYLAPEHLRRGLYPDAVQRNNSDPLPYLVS